MLIKPGFFSVNASADSKRINYDIMNEEYLYMDKKADILFFGDSITDYWELDLYFRNDILKINRGIGGDTTYFASKRFDADVVQLDIPRIVMLLGTNDLLQCAPDLWHRIPGRSVDEVIDEIIENYKTMLSKCTGKDVYIGSVLPMSLCQPYDREFFAAAVIKTNERLKELCCEFGATYVDYYSALAIDGELPEELTPDGVHPNGKAYVKMAEVLKEKVDIL